MREKKVVLLVTLTFLFATITAIPIPVKATEEQVSLTFRYPSGYDYYPAPSSIPSLIWCIVDIEAPMAWDNTASGIAGWILDVCVDPDVLEPYGAYTSTPGYYLYDFRDFYGYVPPDPPIIIPPQPDPPGCILNIAEFLTDWETLGVGAGGNSGPDGWYGIEYGLVGLRFTALTADACSTIEISNAYYWHANGTKHAFDVVDDGHYNQPSPPPVPEFPLGAEAAAGIGLMAAVAYIWLRKHKTKPIVAKRFTTPTTSQ